MIHPEGTKVIDKRNSTEEVNYTATDKGELSLAKDGLELNKMKWLWREGDLSCFEKDHSPATRWLRMMSVTLGVLFVFALFMKFLQWRAQKT